MTRAELDLISYSAKQQEKIDALIAQNAKLREQNAELQKEIARLDLIIDSYC